MVSVLSLKLAPLASATTDECHCPGEVAFTEIVKTAWFKVKHEQTWELSTIGGERHRRFIERIAKC